MVCDQHTHTERKKVPLKAIRCVSRLLTGVRAQERRDADERLDLSRPRRGDETAGRRGIKQTASASRCRRGNGSIGAEEDLSWISKAAGSSTNSKWLHSILELMYYKITKFCPKKHLEKKKFACWFIFVLFEAELNPKLTDGNRFCRTNEPHQINAMAWSWSSRWCSSQPAAAADLQESLQLGQTDNSFNSFCSPAASVALCLFLTPPPCDISEPQLKITSWKHSFFFVLFF